MPFSEDENPYQRHAGLAARGHEPVGGLDLQPGLDGPGLAGGWWQPGTATLTRFRTAVDDPAVARSFDRLRSRLADEGLELDGDELKTAPRGFPATTRAWTCCACATSPSAAPGLSQHVGPDEED